MTSLVLFIQVTWMFASVPGLEKKVRAACWDKSDRGERDTKKEMETAIYGESRRDRARELPKEVYSKMWEKWKTICFLAGDWYSTISIHPSPSFLHYKMFSARERRGDAEGLMSTTLAYLQGQFCWNSTAMDITDRQWRRIGRKRMVHNFF